MAFSGIPAVSMARLTRPAVSGSISGLPIPYVPGSMPRNRANSHISVFLSPAFLAALTSLVVSLRTAMVWVASPRVPGFLGCWVWFRTSGVRRLRSGLSRL